MRIPAISPRPRQRFPIIALVVVVLASGCAIGKALPSAQQMAADAAALEGVLPLMDDIGVTDYRNQDWCKNIEYEHGAFSNNFESSTCNLFDTSPEPFDAVAQADFDRFSRAISDTAVTVTWISVWRAGHLGGIGGRAIKFEVVPRALGFQYWSYTYEPGYILPTEPLGPRGEIELVPIDENWYFIWEEWM